jgi:hypothetical protein
MKSMFLVFSLLFSLTAFGHGDHHHKDRLPPAPHGGNLEEAHKINHKYAINVFFEIKKIGKNVKIYPLMLSPDSSVFNAMNVAKLGKPTFKLKDPRKKKEYTPELRSEKDHWSFSLKGISGRRFIVDISTSLKENKYHGSIQFD